MANPLSSVWEEFKQAPPGGKALAITAVVATAGIGLYVGHHKNSSTNSSNALPVDLSTVPDTGVPFANLPANPPVSTGTTGSTGGTTPPSVPPKTSPPKGGKDTDDKRRGGFHTNPGTPNQSGHGIRSGGAIPPNLHPHTTGIHSISSPPGGTILR